MSFTTTALVLAWVAIALLGLALSGLLRQVSALGESGSSKHIAMGPSVGTVVPTPNAVTRWARETVLLFADQNCSVCERLLPAFATIDAAASEWDFRVVYREGDNGTDANGTDVLTYQSSLFEQLDISTTPYGVAIDSDGRVLMAMPIGSPQMLRNFVEAACERIDMLREEVSIR